MFHNEKGVALIEILIASILILIITITTMNALRQTIVASNNSNQNTAAVNLARQRIEEIKRYESLNLSDPDWRNYLNALPTSLEVDGKPYTVATEFLSSSDISGLPNTVNAVRITVSWEYAGQTEAVSYITYYLK